jgi:hypothetical protein
MLRGDFVHAHVPIIVLAVSVYLASITVGLVRFRRFGNLHLHSSRAACVVQYLFIVQALAMSRPSALLLYLAAGVWIVSSTETLLLQLTNVEVDEHMGTILARRRTRVADSA